MVGGSGAPELGANFWTQYISVILIVLVFTIGSFVMRHIQVKQLIALASESPRSSILSDDRRIGEIVLKGLFSDSDDVQTPGALIPVLTVLRSHDVEGEFTVFKGGSLKSVISKTESLRQLLLGADTPASAFKIYAREDGLETPDLMIRLTRAR